jgi:hypothetical protein
MFFSMVSLEERSSLYFSFGISALSVDVESSTRGTSTGKGCAI